MGMLCFCIIKKSPLNRFFFAYLPFENILFEGFYEPVFELSLFMPFHAHKTA